MTKSTYRKSDSCVLDVSDRTPIVWASNSLTNYFVLTVPSAAPPLTVQSFSSPTEINITWDLLTTSVSHGIVFGYKLLVTQMFTDPLEELLVTIEDGSQTSFIFGNLSVLTKYQVQIAAYTSKGSGNYSDPVFAGKRLS